ncbi:hypothetical protein BDB01DRAFT_884033 [Pilobolus umbonatus]|nr:hypothetical protein BDB01DRAFT_884033 [Pilobolus umbonatus]
MILSMFVKKTGKNVFLKLKKLVPTINLRTLPLIRKHLMEIRDRLTMSPSMPSRQLIIEILRYIDRYSQSLKDKGLIIEPTQFTIDCSDSETNAIRNGFPGCFIQYCLFQVIQAWNRKIAVKVRSGERPADNWILRSGVHGYLKIILSLEDKDRFHLGIDKLISRYYDVWSRAYHPLEFSCMLTNNYIESCHNQLKSVFPGRSGNKRMDRLILILTEEVEYYYREDYGCVEVNHGPMTAAERERRRVQIAAESIPVERLVEMIASPFGSSEHLDLTMWQLQKQTAGNNGLLTMKYVDNEKHKRYFNGMKTLSENFNS